MTEPAAVRFATLTTAEISALEGHLAVIAAADGRLDPLARKVDRLSRGAVSRALAGDAFEDAPQGGAVHLSFPAGMAATGVSILKLDRRADPLAARTAGAAVAGIAGSEAATLVSGTHARAGDVAFGYQLRNYAFDDHRAKPAGPAGPMTVHATDPDAATAAYAGRDALAHGVFLTRDLTNEPANVLTTTEFARRISGLASLGLEVEVLDEPALEALGMRALLAVGVGSESPSHVAIMRWNGGTGAPLALVGKGVVFDTGGISMKPAAGMEAMTMDMGGAGVVTGVMAALARRQARANVVGLVGLVENMPDGRAQRPGDVVRSMKGDTIEVINTDAEGRLVLCDVLWHTQQAIKPAAIIDLATLTGAAIIALGHENAAVFANDDRLADRFLSAAAAEGEGAWRLPLGAGYAKQLKSQIADVKNVGGRPAGAVTAAAFLQRFVEDDMPWVHLDIAGVASRSEGTPLAPKGATGWGVLALNRLIADHFEV